MTYMLHQALFLLLIAIASHILVRDLVLRPLALRVARGRRALIGRARDLVRVARAEEMDDLAEMIDSMRRWHLKCQREDRILR